MIKYILGFLLFVAVVPISNAQTEQELKDLAMAQAKITSDATIAGDYDTVLNYTLPGVLELMGGKEAALVIVAEAMNGLKEQGLSFESSEVTAIIDFAREEEQYRCVVENKVVIKGETSSILSTSYLFGIYDDAISQWYFVEAAQLKNAALLDMILPGFKTELEIPDDVRKTVQH